MRAVIQTRFGGPEVLEVVQAETPRPTTGEVLVRVRASGLNPVESAVRSGDFPLLGEPPFALGWDVSGVVEQAGPETGFAVGDEVFGLPFFPAQAAGYAEYVVAPADQIVRKPAGIDHVHAAALPLAALTAWQALDRAGVGPGHTVLIQRAAGGVGHLAVQLAKVRGAEVIALASAGKHEFVRGLGADRLIDYQTTDFTEAVRGVDVVLDSTQQTERSLAVLRPGGTVVTILEHRDEALAARVRAAGFRFVGIGVEPDGPALKEIADLAGAGRLRPYVAETFPLAEVAKAHELLDGGQVQGKIVLTV
ncbi:MAG TPA: NADP-dependent oxidoreductase [Actinocrinis sp.]|nr:NADP-dependent oxidoreductase [Actinocrinis sp.]